MECITKLCTGCRTCELLCPTKSISMKSDSEGFLAPSINQVTCVDCGICQKCCPQNRDVKSLTPSSVYAFRYKVEDELYKSASGGAFVSIARYFIGNGGVVYGAAYVDADLHVAHIRVSNTDSLSQLQSSKYVQSNTLQTFMDVKKDLLAGFKVLYSGTPCQIAGLKVFLKKDFDKLLTVDLICHGVPSPLLFEKYIQWLSNKISKVEAYNFRDKSRGWGLSFKANSKKKVFKNKGVLDPYYFHFLEGNTYRECCYECRYCRKERVGDITIGDYWGIEKEHPDFFSAKGVSCVLVNTPKGKIAFNEVKEKQYCIDSSFDQVALHNGNLLHSTKRNEIRNQIYTGIKDKPVGKFFNENMAYPRPLAAKIKAIIPLKIIMIIKRLLLL